VGTLIVTVVLLPETLVLLVLQLDEDEIALAE